MNKQVTAIVLIASMTVMTSGAAHAQAAGGANAAKETADARAASAANRAAARGNAANRSGGTPPAQTPPTESAPAPAPAAPAGSRAAGPAAAPAPAPVRGGVATPSYSAMRSISPMGNAGYQKSRKKVYQVPSDPEYTPAVRATAQLGMNSYEAAMQKTKTRTKVVISGIEY